MNNSRMMWVLVIATALFVVMAAAAQADTLTKIRKSGTIVIGYRVASPPFSFTAKDGKAVGYSIDLCKRITAAVQRKLGLVEVKVRYIPVTAENRFSLLANGEVDIVCGSTTNTLKRQERVAFSLLTFVTGADLLVHTGSGINGLRDLSDKRVAVLTGTTTETSLMKAITRLFINAKTVTVRDHNEGLKALLDGKVDAYTADRILLIGLARRAPDPGRLMLTNRYYTLEPYALMVRKNDHDFRLIVDHTLASLYRSKQISHIFAKWFGKSGGRPSRLLQALYMLQGLPKE